MKPIEKMKPMITEQKIKELAELHFKNIVTVVTAMMEVCEIDASTCEIKDVKELFDYIVEVNCETINLAIFTLKNGKVGKISDFTNVIKEKMH